MLHVVSINMGFQIGFVGQLSANTTELGASVGAHSILIEPTCSRSYSFVFGACLLSAISACEISKILLLCFGSWSVFVSNSMQDRH